MKTLSSFEWMTKELEVLKAKDLYREFRVLEELKGTQAAIGGKRVTLFCGNDYLGLSQHPKLIQAAESVCQTHGVGSGAARLISGTTEWHARLEEHIADFFVEERALLFSSGYLANLGVLSALTHPGDTVILDKLCHASLIDAAKLSGADIRVYPHKNLEYLERILKRGVPSPLRGGRLGWGDNPPPLSSPTRGEEIKSKGRVWIVTDSLFSMDGDLAPLKELVELKNRYGAYLVIDEAHGTGVFGEHGRGVSEHLGVSDEIDVHIGTLSKAVGAFGGFVVGERELIEYLINHARTFIFETALPAAICAAAIEGFNLIEQEPELRSKLLGNVRRLRTGLQETGAYLLESESPIIPVMFGEEKKALDAAKFLFGQGFLVPAVRYPTVPKGKARLRVTVSANHTKEEIDRLIQALTHLSR